MTPATDSPVMAAPAPAPRGKNAKFNVDPAELKACIVEYRKSGRLCERLALMLHRIAAGINERHQFSPDRDDFASDCFLHLAYQAPLRRVDPNLNPFGFLYKCAERFGQRRRGRWFKQLRKAAEYRELKAYSLAESLSAEDLGDYCPADAVSSATDPDLKAGSVFLEGETDPD